MVDLQTVERRRAWAAYAEQIGPVVFDQRIEAGELCVDDNLPPGWAWDGDQAYVAVKLGQFYSEGRADSAPGHVPALWRPDLIAGRTGPAVSSDVAGWSSVYYTEAARVAVEALVRWHSGQIARVLVRRRNTAGKLDGRLVQIRWSDWTGSATLQDEGSARASLRQLGSRSYGHVQLALGQYIERWDGVVFPPATSRGARSRRVPPIRFV